MGKLRGFQRASIQRLGLAATLGLAVAGLAGCPIYGDDRETCEGCTPQPGSCFGPGQCGQNETCGADNQCHPGDCTYWGCAAGYQCATSPGQPPLCVPGPTSSSSGGAGPGSGGSGGGNVYCGNPDDCAAGETCGPAGVCVAGSCTTTGCIFGYLCDGATNTCKPTDANACGSDEDCASAGAGFACVSGKCTAPVDQCFDQTQCPAGSKCADGKCTPSCDSTSDCEGGYGCDTAVGLCTVPKQECTITNDCGGPDLVCVDGACVPRAVGGSCPEGSVWVENGCIPDQSAAFTCQVDGVQDACAPGSICLQHSCYISCAANTTVCASLPSFNQCKSVTSSSGPHDVCGSDDNLGSECDPTAGASCQAGKICIDGFCK